MSGLDPHMINLWKLKLICSIYFMMISSSVKKYRLVPVSPPRGDSGGPCAVPAPRRRLSGRRLRARSRGWRRRGFSPFPSSFWCQSLPWRRCRFRRAAPGSTQGEAGSACWVSGSAAFGPCVQWRWCEGLAWRPRLGLAAALRHSASGSLGSLLRRPFGAGADRDARCPLLDPPMGVGSVPLWPDLRLVVPRAGALVARVGRRGWRWWPLRLLLLWRRWSWLLLRRLWWWRVAGTGLGVEQRRVGGASVAWPAVVSLCDLAPTASW
jgi:hypothetical protein